MNGCHNRAPLTRAAPVQDGWVYSSLPGPAVIVVRSARMAHAPHATSADCQYTHSAAGRVDPGCAGCCWRAPD